MYIVKGMNDFFDELDSSDISPSRKSKAARDALKHKAWLTGTPLYAGFELTPLCNLNCKMCYVSLEHDKVSSKSILSAERWISLIDEAYEQGLMFATLTGGECLTHPGFFDIYTHLINLGVTVTILTNGILLNEKNVEFFKKYPPELIQISVYGHDDDSYQAVTGLRLFSAMDSAIDRVREAKLPLRLAITPNKWMLDDFENVYIYAKSKGVPVGINSCLFPPRADTQRKYDDINLTNDDYISVFQKQCKIDGIPLSPSDETDFENNGETREQVGIVCSAGRCYYFINWLGEMIPCGDLDIIKAYPLKTGLRQAWEEINERSVNYVMPIECSGCKLNKICKFCPAEHLLGASEGHCSQNICDFTKKLIKTGLARV